MMTDSERARQYAMELVLIGAALSRSGDGERLRKLIDPAILTGPNSQRCLRAINAKDRDGVCDFLARIGVSLNDGESAIDGVLRTTLANAEQELKRLLDSVQLANQKEIERQSAKKESKKAS